MNSVTLALLFLGISTLVVGILVMIRSIGNSPEGYQDSEGFQFGRPSEELVVRSSVAHAHVLEHAA